MTVRFHSKSTASLTLVRRSAAQNERDSDEDIIRPFVDAMTGVGVDTLAYASTVRGTYELSARSSRPTAYDAPRELSLDLRLEAGTPLRLGPDERRRLGFVDGKDVFVSPVGDDRIRGWLLVVTGDIPASDAARLAVYVDLLDQALKAATRYAATCLQSAILDQLLPAGAAPVHAARAALRTLATSTGGTGAALMVTTTGGVHVFSSGASDVFSMPAQHGHADDIVTTCPVLPGYSMTLAVRRLAGTPFSGREQYLLDTATPVFATWASSVLQPASDYDEGARTLWNADCHD